MRLQALAAQYAEAREEELDRNGEDEQPGESDEDLARHTHPDTPFLLPSPEVSRWIACRSCVADLIVDR